jgi:hypothetical protein
MLCDGFCARMDGPEVGPRLRIMRDEAPFQAALDHRAGFRMAPEDELRLGRHAFVTARWPV